MCALGPDTDPDTRSEGKCGSTKTNSGKPCQYQEGRGRGRDCETGLCSLHQSAGAPINNDNAVGASGNPDPADKFEEGNTESIRHGSWADESRLYSEVFTPSERDLVDSFEADYAERYEAIHSEAPIAGEAFRLFQIAVHHVTEIRADNWALERPQERHSPHPFVDRKEIPTEHGTAIEYETSAAQKFHVTLTSKDRQWLKDMGLLASPERQQADALQTIAGGISYTVVE